MGLMEFYPPLALGQAVPFLASPVFHRGERVGNIFLADRDGDEEFTQADEETLVMFASQAALVIANARTYRDERRVRHDLETLVNTSPVGVVVLDAQTGSPVSFNREAVRIVGSLQEPDRSPEDLLDVITCVRADGRELTLREFPMADILSAGETIRAEEIVLRVPDGRSVSVLVNATPIHSEDGRLASFVVTLQDMTPLEELERLRAEFLAMVSHELRTPLAAVKGSITTLMEAVAELDPAEMMQFFHIIRDQSDQMRYLIGDLLDVARIETGTLSVAPEPSDVRILVDEASKRFTSGGGAGNLQVEVAADLPLVMADKRRIIQVLSNLLSNAAGYSPEGSPILVTATQDGVHVAVTVTDEGRGIPADQMPRLFRKFSRVHGADAGSGVDGSGLGLAICKGIVEAPRGPYLGRERRDGSGGKVHLYLADR